MSREAFSLEDGLTVEVEGLVPLSGGLFQSFIFGFAADVPPEPADPAWDPRGNIAVTVGPTSLTMLGARARGWLPLPLPDGSDRWHRYTLQIEPDGRLSLLIDGRMHYRANLDGVPVEAHILVAGNTLGTEILHGAVTLYRGAKYSARD